MNTLFNGSYERQMHQHNLDYQQKRIAEFEAVFALLIPLAAHGAEDDAATEAVTAIGAALTRLRISESHSLIKLERLDQEERERNAVNDETAKRLGL